MREGNNGVDLKGNVLWGWEVDGTDLGSCPENDFVVGGFSVSTGEIVIYVVT